MSQRWICTKCSARNDEINFSCQKCGQVRGLDGTTPETRDTIPIPASDPSTPDPTPSTLPTRPRSRVRLLWIPAIAAIVFSFFSTDGVPRDDQGRITSSASMSVHDLQIGDCFDMSGGVLDDEWVDEVDTVQGVPCELDHEYEVFAMGNLDDGPYPSGFRFDRTFESVCIDAFEEYVGVHWDLSEVWADMLWPTEEGWNDGDRSITCFLYLPDARTTGPLRGSGR